MSDADIFSQALSLPLPQRELAHRLIDSLHGSDGPPAGPSDEEVQRRLAAVASGQFQADDWRQAMARMRASLADESAQAE